MISFHCPSNRNKTGIYKASQTLLNLNLTAPKKDLLVYMDGHSSTENSVKNLVVAIYHSQILLNKWELKK